MILLTNLPFHLSGIVESIAGTVIVFLGLKAWKGFWTLKASVFAARNRSRLDYSKKRLKELEEPDYLSRTQRNMYRNLGLSIYALGAYLLFSQYAPSISINIIKFVGAAFIMLLGGLATSNAVTMNMYGIKKVRGRILKDIEKYEKIATKSSL